MQREGLELRFQEAFLNLQLARAWAAGAVWAAVDYNGLELTQAHCTRHRATYQEVSACI